MPQPAKVTYHGKTIIGRRKFAEFVGIGEDKLKQVIAGLPVSEWQDAVDRYRRLKGEGPMAGIPTSRGEIVAYLAGIKKSGIVVSLDAAPIHLKFILDQTAGLGTEDRTERIYCWLEGLREIPRCTCGRPRSFDSIPDGYYPTCGMSCPNGHALGRPEVRDKVMAAIADKATFTIKGRGDEAYRNALRSLREEIDPKHHIAVLGQFPRLRKWIDRVTAHLPEDASLLDRVHVALTGESLLCHRGGRRRVSRLSNGLDYCGHQSECACSREATGMNVKETILEAAPSDYITLHEWARMHDLNVSTVIKDFRRGLMSGVEHGRNYFVHKDTPPPCEEDKVTCRHCGRTMLSITNHHLATHDGMTRAQYRRRYGGPMTGHRTRRNISSATLAYMASLTPEERQARYKSKPERYFLDYLMAKGYVLGETVYWQATIQNGGRALYDFFLPEDEIVIEIDGPHHWNHWPYGHRGEMTPEMLFEDQQRKDRERNERVASNGYRMVRIKVVETLYDYPGGDFQAQLREHGVPEHLLGDPFGAEVLQRRRGRRTGKHPVPEQIPLPLLPLA